jgi:hypothetical protein
VNPEDLNLSNAIWWTSDLIVYSVILFTLFVTANGIKCVTCFNTNNNKTAMTNGLQLDPQRAKIIKSTGRLFRGWNSLACRQELSQHLKSFVYQIYIRAEHVHHYLVTWESICLLAVGGCDENECLCTKMLVPTFWTFLMMINWENKYWW